MYCIIFSLIIFSGELPLQVLDLLVHGANSILMLIELLVILHPMYFLQVIYTLLIGVIYALFTLIYFYTGGKNSKGDKFIYNILDWKDFGKTCVVVLGVIILATLLHAFACFIQTLRVRVHRYGTKSQRSYNLSV